MTETELQTKRIDELNERLDLLWDTVERQRAMIAELASQQSELVRVLEMNFQNIYSRLPKAK